MKLTHVGDIYSYKEKFKGDALDYSANINPLGMPEGVKKALINSIDTWVNYPDPLCRELKDALSKSEGIDKDYLILGNGAADVIFRLVYAVKPKNAMVLAPTFSEYEEALNAVHCKVKYHYLKEENDFILNEDIINSITSHIDMIFICNPNNPTGELTSVKLLEKILEKCNEEDVLLVIDECFNDFVEEQEKYTMKSYLKDNKNLFILKAFTKIYAMAGVRLGYGLSSDSNLLELISKGGQPWGVSIPAQIAGIQALKEEQYLIDTEELILKEREYLITELKKLNIKVYGSKANYIFFRGFSGVNLKELLEQRGIMIRDCGNYIGLQQGFYRICVKGHKENERLINEIRTIRGNI